MTRLSVFLIGITTLLLTACEVAPEKIEYGTDACSYCDMTIVDPKHASQVVTKKGKNYKYDAVECMVHHLQDALADQPIALTLVDRKSTRLNSSHVKISYAVFCLKKKKN